MEEKKHFIKNLTAVHIPAKISRNVLSVWVFWTSHSQIIGYQRKESEILTPLYNFHQPNEHLDISGAIKAQDSPLLVIGIEQKPS